MTILRFDDVTRHFGRRAVIDSVDLELAAEEKVALRGPNGAGKTTLLRLAAGTLRPSQGAVGRPDTIGFLAQDAPCYRELSVVDHVRFAARMHGLQSDPHAAIPLLMDAGLARLADRPAGTLSRGQRQRLGLVLAMTGDPDILLLDEPATALDADGVAWLTQTLDASDAAILAAVHDDAPFAADRTITIDGGRLQ